MESKQCESLSYSFYKTIENGKDHKESYSLLSQHKLIQQLQDKINYKFTNPLILMNSLAHRSFIHEFKELGLTSNERLEFMGDSLLNAIISLEIMGQYPELDEGKLSKLRGTLVNEETLFLLATHHKFNILTLLGRGELKRSALINKTNTADLFEALIGAIYKDSQSFEITRKIVITLYKTFTKNLFALENLNSFDPKTQLQELSMKAFKNLPLYQTKENDKNGRKEFSVSLSVGEFEFGPINGPSKKKLKVQLAQLALDKIDTPISEESNAYH